MGNIASALNVLQRLVRQRRTSEDWVLLAICFARLGRSVEAVRCLQQAVGINPFRPDVHQLLAEGYQHLGNQTEADRFRQNAVTLSSARSSATAR